MRHIEHAMSELRTALAQTIPSDDKIIAGHIQNALDLLVEAQKNVKKASAILE